MVPLFLTAAPAAVRSRMSVLWASGIVAGQPLSASALSGGSASVDGGFAWTTPAYTPPAGTAPQSVTFSPEDSGNYSNALGSVTVTVLGGRVETIALTNGAVTFRCRGSPGERYHVERTTRLAEPVVWTLLTFGTPLQVQPDGTAEFTDPNPPQAAAIIYRLVQTDELPQKELEADIPPSGVWMDEVHGADNFINYRLGVQKK